MSDNETFMLIKDILVSSCDWLIDPNKITKDSRLREDLELDSLSLVNLQVKLEDELEIRFDPVEMDLTQTFKTVGTLVSFLENTTGFKKHEN